MLFLDGGTKRGSNITSMKGKPEEIIAEVEINEEKGRVVFDMKLAFEENGVIALPEYTDKQFVAVQRYLYLKKINDE